MAGSRLTVFILTYNHKKYIHAAFDSILAQETSFAFKIIVLDDASTDGTSDIVREYAGKYPDRIIPIIREKNLGIVENMYRGLCLVDTEYFAVLEGDDYWCDDHKLQRQIDLLDADPTCDICGHDTFMKRFDNGKVERMYQHDTAGKSDVIVLTGSDIQKLHPSSRLYRHVYDFSKVHPKAAVVFDSCRFWFYCLQNPRLIFINKPMSVYNYTGEGVDSGATRKQRRCLKMRSIIALNEAFDYKYDEFNYRRFKKACRWYQRPFFALLHQLSQKHAYSFFSSRHPR